MEYLEFIRKVKNAHWRAQISWVGWVPVGFLSSWLVESILSILHLDLGLIWFLSMIAVMFFYMKLVLAKQLHAITKLECPACSNAYFGDGFPLFLRKTNCSSCGRRIDFYSGT